MRVLLLDCTYEPLKIIGWQRAIYLLFSGKAEIVEESEHEVRSPSTRFTLPSVIRQLAKFRRRKGVPFTKKNIFIRDNWTCQYCAKEFDNEDLTFDHVIPRSQGGRTTWENIATACQTCNWKKANRTPSQAGMKLIKPPEKPKVIMTIRLRDQVPEKWKPYLDPGSYAYWNAELEST